MKPSKYKINDVFFLMLAGIMFTWGIAGGVLKNMEVAASPVTLLVITAAFIACLRALAFNKVTLCICGIIITISAIFILADININPDSRKTIMDAVAFLRRYFLYIGGYEPYKLIYDEVTLWGVCGLVSLFTVVCTSVRCGFYVMFAGAIALYGILFTSSELDFGMAFAACVMGLMFVFVITHSLRGRSTWKTNARALTAVTICFAAAYFIPASYESNPLAPINNLIYPPMKSVSGAIRSVFAPKYFYLSSTGYLGKDNRLGGDTSLSDEVVMEVTSTARESLYLAGAYKDKYTGYSWENTAPDSKPFAYPGKIPTIEFSEQLFSNFMMSLEIGEFDYFGALMADPSIITNSPYAGRCAYIKDGVITLQMQQSVFNAAKVSVRIKNSSTYTVFSLGLGTGAAPQSGAGFSLRKDGESNLTSSSLIKKDAIYDIFYRKEPRISYYESIIEYSRKGILVEMRDKLDELHAKYDFDKNQISICLDESLDDAPQYLHMLKMYPNGTEYYNPVTHMCYEDFLNGVLIPRAEEIYKRYTALPADFPERIALLAQKITAEQSGDFWKAKKIEMYLRKFPYTLAPGDTPKNRDFVDYFLFDLQKGYCTYFATAFVTMCRSIGLPARYVEGYVTPEKGNEEGVRVVTNRLGHAWGEVYFEGFGWVRFEPTPADTSQGTPAALPRASDYPPPVPQVRINAPAASDSVKASDPTEEAVPAAASAINLANGNISRNKYILMPHADGSAIRRNWAAGAGKSLNAQNNGDTGSYATRVIGTSLLIFAALALAYLFANYMLRRRRKSDIGKKPSGEAALMYFDEMLKCFKLLGIEKKSNETIMQYTVRVYDSGILPVSSLQLRDICEIMSVICYGGKNIDSSMMIRVRDACMDVHKIMPAKLGKVKYFYCVYVTRMI